MLTTIINLLAKTPDTVPDLRVDRGNNESETLMQVVRNVQTNTDLSYLNFVKIAIQFAFQAATILGIAMLVYIGIRLIMDRGNAAEFKKHLKNLLYILLGFVIMGLAYTVVYYLAGIDIFTSSTP